MPNSFQMVRLYGRVYSIAQCRVALGLLAWFTLASYASAAQRGVNVSDCVRTIWAKVGEVKLSPDGNRVAYLTRQADIGSNRNIERVWVRELKNLGRVDNGVMLFESQELSRLRWLANGRKIAVLSRKDGASQINIIDVGTGKYEVAVTQRREIMDYGVDATGNTIAFSVEAPLQGSGKEERKNAESGVLVPFGVPFSDRLRDYLTGRSELYLVRTDRDRDRKVSSLNVPLGANEQTLRDLRYLEVSPDGRYLIFSRRTDVLPEHWKEDLIVRWRAFGGPVRILYLYDLESNHVRVAFDAPSPGVPLWAPNSRAFTVFATSPVGSSWQALDFADFDKTSISKWGPLQTLQDPRVQSLYHLFAVDVQTGDVSLVLRRLNYEFARVSVNWTNGSDEIECLIDVKTVVRLARQDMKWNEVGRFINPHLRSGGFANPSLSIGRGLAVGVHQTASLPPEVYLYSLSDGQAVRLTNLNAEFDHLSLGAVESITWTNKYGATATGYLIKPVGYKPGRLYPLVVMAKTWNERFICDGFGSGETTAFPPQPLASAGFVVLLANDPSLEQQPLDFPGRMGEVYNWIESIKSAVEMLASQHLISPTNVGIIGFSRTSWKVDFMLTHSDVRFVAASSADGGLYNYGVYWTLNNLGLSQSLESQVGGPPYGKTLENWLKFAPAFNAEKVTCPILMEYTSSGGLKSDPISAYEFFTALNRQGKPVELYFYPQGQHQLDTPLARLSSLQLNVDWFRFWMQGYERPNPDDPEQYVRWRRLRKLAGNRM